MPEPPSYEKNYNPSTPIPDVHASFLAAPAPQPQPQPQQQTGDMRPLRPASAADKHHLLHRHLTTWMQKMISRHRHAIGVDTYWNIHPLVKCPEDLPYSEGQVTWHPNHNRALIELRCDFEEDMATHVLVHELFELQDWETADIFLTSLRYVKPEELGTLLFDQYRQARNRKIEMLVTRYLGKPRPSPGQIYGEEVLIDDLPVEEKSPSLFIRNTMKQTAVRINTNSQPLL